jgi:hypothetical protein
MIAEPASGTAEPAGAAPPSPVLDDLLCGDCEYNLRTLSWEANCPECGTPVRDSHRLPGFRFSGLAARRVRAVLGLLVIAALIRVFAEVWYTFTLMNFFQIINRSWVWASFYTWLHASTAATIVQFAAIYLVQRLLRNAATGATLLLPRVTLGVGSVALVAHLINSASSRPFGARIPGWLTGVLVEPPALLGSVLALILVWVCLLRLVDRGAGRGLWRATAVSVGLAGIAGLHRLMSLVFFLGMQMTGTNSSSNSDEPWWLVFGSLWEPCRKYVGAPCGILMLLVIWAYLRKLDVAMRRTRSADSDHRSD